MTARKYIDNAPTTTVSGAINASVTSFTVASLAGFPATFPYSVTLGLGTASAEQVLVTAAVGTTVTVTRNSNGQGAFSHPDGETFEHTAVAQDYSEANAHVNASTGVHGVTGAVVGTTDTQTLTNKTLTAPVVNDPTINKAGQPITLPAGPDTLVGRASTDTLLNKTLASPVVTGSLTLPTGDVTTSWATYTPTFTNCTSPTGEFAYKQVGKALHIRGFFKTGTTTTGGTVSVSLPAGLLAAGSTAAPAVQQALATAGSSWTITANSANLTCVTGFSSGAPLVGVMFTGVIEVQ